MAVSLGTTPSGKTVEAYMQEGRALYRMRLVPGGALPEALSGEYTSVGECKLKADVWLAKKEVESTQAKARGGSRVAKKEQA